MTMGYLMAPVRGEDGDNVTPEVKEANVQAAITIGWAIRRAFPDINLFVPHEHERIVDMLWRNGLPSTDIVTATSQIAVESDISFCWDLNGVSSGMYRELVAVHNARKPVVYFEYVDDEMIAETASILAGKE